MTSSEQRSLIEYPCNFPIKVVGRVGTSMPGTLPGSQRDETVSEESGNLNPPVQQTVAAALLEQRRQDFMQSVLTIVKYHAPDFDPANLEVRISRKNTYLSLTCTIRATSREQLDRLYQELCDQPNVVMVL